MPEGEVIKQTPETKTNKTSNRTNLRVLQANDAGAVGTGIIPISNGDDRKGCRGPVLRGLVQVVDLRLDRQAVLLPEGFPGCGVSRKGWHKKRKRSKNKGQDEV